MLKQLHNIYYSIVHQDGCIDRGYTTDNAKLNIEPKLLRTCFLCNFDQWDIALHSHKFFEIAFISKGKCLFNIDGVDYEVSNGNLVLLNQGTVHIEKQTNDEPIEVFFASFSNIYFEGLPENCLVSKQQSPIIHSGLLESKFKMNFSELIVEASNQGLYKENYLAVIGKIIILDLFRLLSHNYNDKYLVKEFKTLVAYIDNNYEKDITLDSLANRINYSRHHFSRMFKRQIGESPIKYLHLKRLSEACRC